MKKLLSGVIKKNGLLFIYREGERTVKQRCIYQEESWCSDRNRSGLCKHYKARK